MSPEGRIAHPTALLCRVMEQLPEVPACKESALERYDGSERTPFGGDAEDPEYDAAVAALGHVPCPDWCTLTPGHGIDDYDNSRKCYFRTHGGPTFGLVWTWGVEYPDAPGVVIVVAGTDDTFLADVSDRKDVQGTGVMSGSRALEVARWFAAAGEWVEAHSPRPGEHVATP